MDTTDEEGQVVTKHPIVTAKTSPSSTAEMDTAKPPPIAAIPVVVTRAPGEIVTISPIEKEKQHFNLLLLQFYKC